MRCGEEFSGVRGLCEQIFASPRHTFIYLECLLALYRLCSTLRRHQEVCSPLFARRWGRRMLWFSVFLITPLNRFQFLRRFSHCAKVNFPSMYKQSINLLVWSNNRGSNQNSGLITCPKGFLGRILISFVYRSIWIDILVG